MSSTDFSKTLSYLLRHGAVKNRLNIQPDGYVLVDDLLKLDILKKYRPTLEMLQSAARNCPKQRFGIKTEDGRWYIRANQGHTIKTVGNEGLMRITDPSEHPIVVHGTYLRCWPDILRTGLSKMARNHIHMARGEPGTSGVISGMRTSCQVMIYIDLPAAMRDGIPFWISENGVILSEGISGKIAPRYFKKVVRVSDGSVLFP